MLPQYFSSAVSFDGFGLEIAYHVRTETKAYQYEGVEILTVVLSKADALSYPEAADETGRQEILDESEIYLNDSRFGLSLEGSEPRSLDTLEREPDRESFPTSEDHQPRSTREADSTPSNPGSAAVGSYTTRPVSVPPSPNSGLQVLRQDVPKGPPVLRATAPASARREVEAVSTDTRPSQTELDALENKYRQEFESLAKEGTERYHFVSYAPPSLIVFHQQNYLQLTLRNPIPFDRNTTSIYKRAAQDFDLFLAPILRAILDKVPGDQRIAGLDIALLDRFGADDRAASEAIEFFCPLLLLRQFSNAEVTSQEVIDHTIVLVNGMRIGLDLQRVE
jgi:hypothetical protein